MTTQPTNHASTLRRALLLDAVVSGTTGIILVLAAGPAEQPLGLPAALLRWAGVVLIPFAAHLAWAATRARDPRGPARAIIWANVLWTVGSVLLLVGGVLSPTPLGEAFVLVQAVAVAGFAYLEYIALRRAGGPLVATVTAPHGERGGR